MLTADCGSEREAIPSSQPRWPAGMTGTLRREWDGSKCRPRRDGCDKDALRNRKAEPRLPSRLPPGAGLSAAPDLRWSGPGAVVACWVS